MKDEQQAPVESPGFFVSIRTAPFSALPCLPSARAQGAAEEATQVGLCWR